ncbi:GtrA family protein [Tepidibacter sp. Z1-5]|uniref:GtrA family protein n=1 Tax=Tepidibacter sp. Z1-5 TaxID=3134138 RepID=UPI004040A67B
MSTTIAFFIFIIFAYVTNKIWVFKSNTKDFKRIVEEFSRFLLARISTYFIDLVGLVLLVEYLEFNQTIGKIIMNIIIVILNYILSKKVCLENNSYE